MKLNSLIRSLPLLLLTLSFGVCSVGCGQAQPRDDVKATKTSVTSTQVRLEFRIAQDEASEGFTQRPGPDKRPIFVSDQVGLSAEDISEALIIFDANSKQLISLRLNAASAKKLAQLTASNVGKKFAIMINNVIHQAPVIKDRVDGGRVVISLDTPEETKTLFKQIQTHVKNLGH